MSAAVHESRERVDRARSTADLLEQIGAATNADLRLALRDELVRINMSVADAVVSRYRSRGIPVEDLRQVAYLALVRSADNFDLASGNDFLSYAVPTMRGEVRRWFRDHGWMVRPPRRIQELQARVTASANRLRAELGRSPTAAELARDLDEEQADVEECLADDGCFWPTSLDRPVGDDADSGLSLGDLLASQSDDLPAAEARLVLEPAVRRLKQRDQEILSLRFYEGRTQQEIADTLGISQMQVSRLLTRILRDLREALGEKGASGLSLVGGSGD